MTTKYESVLSEADKKEIREKYLRGFISQKPCDLIELTEQATLAKLQPQLDAIGAGGVSGKRITKKAEEWVLSLDGRSLYSSDFTHDVMLRVSGDFENDDQRIEYSKSLIAKLNAPIAHQVSLGGQPFRKQPKNTEETPCINTQYSDFKKWCDDNPSFDLDARLHTHSGRLGDGGYISDEKTRIAFSAYRAATKTTPAGYKLVPIEPTPEMLSVAIKMALNAQIGFDYDWRDYTGDLWSAILSAAPTPDTE